MRALRLRRSIISFCYDHDDLPIEDELAQEDWEHLQLLHDALKLFHDVSHRLQGQGRSGHHGCIWEALPALEALLAAAEVGRQLAPQPQYPPQPEISQIDTPAERTRHRQQRRPAGSAPPPEPEAPSSIAIQMGICWQNAWEVLRKYNRKTDEAFPIFAAARLLNTSLRKGFFEHYWTESSEQFIKPMLTSTRDWWEDKYMQNQPAPASGCRHNLNMLVKDRPAESRLAVDVLGVGVYGRVL
jgi:hypothetical protein